MDTSLFQVVRLAGSSQIYCNHPAFGESGQRYFLYEKDGAVHMNVTKPKEHEGEVYERTIKVYEAQCKSKRMSMPKVLLLKMGWKSAKSHLSFRELEFGHIVITSATKDEIEKYATKRQRAPVKGRVCGKAKRVHFTPEQKEFLDIKTYNSSLRMTLNFVDGVYIQLEAFNPRRDCNLLTLWQAHKLIGKNAFYSTPQTIRTDLASGLHLPTEFIKRCGVEVDDILNMYTKGSSIIIEGKKESCDFCGDEISTFSSTPTKGYIDAHCNQQLGKMKGVIACCDGDVRLAAQLARTMLRNTIEKMDEEN